MAHDGVGSNGHSKRYVAFLRGVPPPGIQDAFAAAGFTRVGLVRSARNVLFSAPRAPESVLERQAEAAIARRFGESPLVIVRSLDRLRTLVEADPYAPFPLPPRSQRAVTFLLGGRKPRLVLPLELQDSQILRTNGREVFSAYVPTARGPVFMGFLENTLGAQLTTRPWETVAKVVAPERV